MTIVISEHEMCVVCDNGKCTCLACYVVVVHTDSTYVRLYCADCTRRLTEGTANLVRDSGSTLAVHDLLEVEYLSTGRVIVNV